MQAIQVFQKAILIEIEKLPIQGNPDELYEPIRYILQLGGKRLRPVLTLMAADAFGNWQDAIPAALSVEVFHNFTLVHDDIMDEAPLRRGKETVHHKWDVNRGILSGDAMLVKAYQILASQEKGDLASLLKVFNQTALEVCEGQQLDVNFEDRDDVSESDYIEMIRLKTSVLLGAALQLGAIVSGASESDQHHLYNYGVQMGIAFQIKDDMLDVYGDPEKVGKQVGGDILANKKTLLMLHAIKTASGNEATQLRRWLATTDSSSEKVTEVTAIFNMTGAKEAAEKVIQDFYQSALKELDETSLSPDKKQLFLDFASWLMDRDY